MVSELADLLIVVAAQHRGQVSDPEGIRCRNAALSSFAPLSSTSIVAGGSRQLSQLPQLSGRVLTEMPQQDGAAAVAASTKAAVIEPLAFLRAPRQFDLGFDAPTGTGKNPRHPRTARPRPSRRPAQPPVSW